MKDHALAGGKVRSRHCQWDAQFFKRLHLQELVQESDHALVAGEAVARQRPAGNMLEAYLGGNLLEVSGREPAAIRGADECADAGARNVADGDVFFFEDFENADVGDAASKTAAES